MESNSKPKEPAAASAVAITIAYALTSSLLSIINKYAVSVFPFPGLLAMIQYLVSVLAVYFLGKFKILEHDPLQWDKLKAFFPSALVFFLAVFSNMKVLHYANVDTFIIFRSSTPLLVAVADSLFMKRPWPSNATFVSLVVILLGAVGYVATDFEISVAAYSWATFYLITITTEMVYIKHVVSTIGLKTWGLVYYNNIFALLLSPIFIFITGEGFGIAELFQPSTSESTSMSDLSASIQMEGAKYLTLASYGPVALSCIFGLAISFCGFACRQALSATSFTVVGVTNKLLTVLINVTVWSKHAGTFGVCMLLVCIGGGVLYQQSMSPPKKSETPKPPRGDVEEAESTSLLKGASSKGGASCRVEGR